MATLSRLIKGTKGEEADLSIVGLGVVDDLPSNSEADERQQQRISQSLLKLAMQIRPEAYYRRNLRAVEDLKVAGQKLHV